MRYDESDAVQKAQLVQTYYELRDGKETYATSPDFNLREIEIDFIIDSIRGNIKSQSVPRILDIGCGNGYTDLRIAKELKADIVGIDFSEGMINGAEHLRDKFKNELAGNVSFMPGDVLELDWDSGHFDFVVSERCLLNLPDRECQYKVIAEVHRVLKTGGIYVMVEGTHDGLDRLNSLRRKVGLEPIPDRAKGNESSLKFDEQELEEFLPKYFRVIRKQYFGMYYLISRIVHPLLVFPEFPKFDAKINEVARTVAKYEPDYKNIGHIMGLVLEAM